MVSRRTFMLTLALIALLAPVTYPDAHAQSAATLYESTVSLGGLVGRTNGLTARVTFRDRTRRSGPFLTRAVDANLSFNLDGYLLFSAHVTAERELEDSPLQFFIGPGFAAGAEDSDIFWGSSANVGTYFLRGRYEVVLQLMPRLRIVPELFGEIGAAAGLRVRL